MHAEVWRAKIAFALALNFASSATSVQSLSGRTTLTETQTPVINNYASGNEGPSAVIFAALLLLGTHSRSIHEEEDSSFENSGTLDR